MDRLLNSGQYNDLVLELEYAMEALSTGVLGYEASNILSRQLIGESLVNVIQGVTMSD
jgi:hypothetical protein